MSEIFLESNFEFLSKKIKDAKETNNLKRENFERL